MEIEAYLGQIQLFPFNFAPIGWMLCNGATLNISQYSALYSLIGNTYGGDGHTTFQIPNLQGASPIPNMEYYIVVEGGIFPMRP